MDISFDVLDGEILGLIGPNGAGKTSLFNSISGEVSPDKGTIHLAGQRISGAGPVACARAGVARTFQVVRSFDSMTVLENVMVGAFARTARSREAMRAAQDVLAFCRAGRPRRRPGAPTDPTGKAPPGNRPRPRHPAPRPVA